MTNRQLFIAEFRVTNLEPIKVDIKGLTIALDWIAEDIAELAAEELTNQIVYTIEHQARDVFQKAMDKLVIP